MAFFYKSCIRAEDKAKGDAIKIFQGELQWAHELLEMVMEDVTTEQAHWIPAGIANPLGALYAHAVLSEDVVINAVVGGRSPLFMNEWAGRCGIANPQMSLELDWARELQVDLTAMRSYAQAVYAATDEFLATLAPQDLACEYDLTEDGFSHQTLAWIMTALVVSHLNNMAGEICLKGIQGARGYPF